FGMTLPPPVLRSYAGKEFAHWFGLGASMSALDRNAEALSYWDRALAADISNWGAGSIGAAWYNRGQTLTKLGERTAAVASYRKALDLNPGMEQAWNNLALALHKLGRVEEALTAHDEAIRQSPTSSTYRFNKAVLLESIGLR